MVEPVGGHGGMDYYDFALCDALSGCGASVTLHTCDETSPNPIRPFETRLSYSRIYGPDPSWLRGIRYALGSLTALVGERLSGTKVCHLHFFHTGVLELFDALLAKSLGFTLVATAHDVRSFAGGSSSAMSRAIYRLPDAVVVHNEPSRRELVEVAGVPKGKISTIPHGNYLPFIGDAPSKREARSRLGLAGDAPVVLFFGQIKEVKGLDVLIEAMPGVLREFPDALLVVAGKVWKDDFRVYREMVGDLGVAENCVLDIRYVPDEDAARYYAASDIVVLPYRRIYQSGVLLMAMSHGKPVVVSDIEGMTETISDDVNGFVFRSGDPTSLAARVIAALSNPEAARAVGERGLSHVKERHGWAGIGAATMELYRSLEG